MSGSPRASRAGFASAIPPALLARPRRPRVGALLDRALDPTTRVTVVAAPPGYGKSVAVAGWAAGTAMACAWVTLDETSGDAVVLARRVLDRLATVRDGVDPDALAAGVGADPRVAAGIVLAAIASDDDELLVVLDDWHRAGTPEADAFLRALVDRCPPFAHVVVIGREDPGLPLARLRAHGSLVEVRAPDLRFTEAEARELLAASGVDAGERLAELVRVTEGWAAPLQLAALAGRRGGGPPVLAADDRNLVDYLAEEVIADLDDATRGALERLAVAERFPPSLAASVTGGEDAPAVLDGVLRDLRFVERDEAEPGWYRLHPLVAAYLRGRLPASTRAAVHRDIADWLWTNGHRRAAVPHLLEGHHPEAPQRIAQAGRGALEAGELTLLGAWLTALGDAVVHGAPDLAVLDAWRRFQAGDLVGALGLVERVGPSLAPSAALGRLRILRATVESTTHPRAEADGLEGIELVGDDPWFRALGLAAVGLARLARGDLGGALGTLRDALDAAHRTGRALAEVPAANALAHALEATGHRDEAEILARDVLARLGGGVRPPAAWSVELVLGIALFEGGDLAEARQQLERGLADARTLGIGDELLGWALPTIALVRAATGDGAGAARAVEATLAAGRMLPSLAGETRARIALARGDLAAARRWAAAAHPEAPDGSPLLPALVASMATTIARVRLAEARSREALDALADAERHLGRTPPVPELVSIRLLAARARLALGDRAAAEADVRAAVELGAPGGYVRRFVDDGQGLEALVAPHAGSAPGFVARVVGTPGSTGARSGPSVVITPDGRLVETLTPRELDVLRLVARGETNAGIGEALGMSAGTAKWHVAHVLAKLGARSRTQAVVTAQEVGIL